jgi:hypothetical protein
VCHGEFPRWKTGYNLVMFAGVVLAGARTAASLGSWVLLGFLGSLAAGLGLALGSVCHRCAYHGRRCGFGLGKLVPWLRRRGDPAGFCKTWPQLLSVAFFGAMIVLGLVGAGRMLYWNQWPWPTGLLLSMLGLILPHPRWMCGYCAQRGRCPLGRAIARPVEVE